MTWPFGKSRPARRPEPIHIRGVQQSPEEWARLGRRPEPRGIALGGRHTMMVLAADIREMGRFVEAMNRVAPCPSCGGPDGAQPPEHGAEHAPYCLFADAADAWDRIRRVIGPDPRPHTVIPPGFVGIVPDRLPIRTGPGS